MPPRGAFLLEVNVGRKATGRGTRDLFAGGGGLAKDLGKLLARDVSGAGDAVGCVGLASGEPVHVPLPAEYDARIRAVRSAIEDMHGGAVERVLLPVMQVRLVEAKKVFANNYNPNKVAFQELLLLAVSILRDGMTQPIVTCYDSARDVYEVVDGFHRYLVMVLVFRQPLIPVVCIPGGRAELMAATVRHNRARGKHQVDLQAELVKKLIGEGLDDGEVGEALGMTTDEVVRLKQIVGIARMCAGGEYSRAFGTAGEFPVDVVAGVVAEGEGE